MSILKVSRMGHPVLREKAEPVEMEMLKSKDFQRTIDDMIETMREYNGVGLAAPQVHLSLQLLVYEVEDNPRYPGREEAALNVLINPIFEAVGEEQEDDWEGCLSIPDIRGLVPRHCKIKVTALNRNGVETDFIAEDFEARVIQHEIDHLDGILFFDRMTDFQSLTFMDEFMRYWADEEEEEE